MMARVKTCAIALIACGMIFMAVSCSLSGKGSGSAENKTDGGTESVEDKVKEATGGYGFSANLLEIEGDWQQIADGLGIEYADIYEFVMSKRDQSKDALEQSITLGEMIAALNIDTSQIGAGEQGSGNPVSPSSFVPKAFSVRSQKRIAWTGSEENDFEYYDYQVVFDKGNLFHSGSDPNSGWGTEEHQYDFRTFAGGDAVIQGKKASTAAGDCGLFHWLPKEEKGKQYDLARAYAEDYKFDKSEVDYESKYDVELFTNGEDSVMGEEWNSLTYHEWWYLLTQRTCGESSPEKGALLRNGFATIKVSDGVSIKGFVILPDDWTTPEGCEFESHYEIQKRSYHAVHNYPENYWEDLEGPDANVYDLDAWSKMEKAGAVFFPMAGYRSGKQVKRVGEDGLYWTGTQNPSWDRQQSAGLVFWYTGENNRGWDQKMWFYAGSDDLTLQRDLGLAMRLAKRVSEPKKVQ